MKSYLLNTQIFSQQGQLNDQDIPFWIFLSLLRSLWLNEQRRQKKIATTPFCMVPLSDNHMNSLQAHISHCCICALISHLSCSKLQQESFIRIHPQLQPAVISLHVLLRAPASTLRSIYWISDSLTHFFLFKGQHFGDILYEQLIHTTTNCYCEGKVCGFRYCLFRVWNKKLHLGETVLR